MQALRHSKRDPPTSTMCGGAVQFGLSSELFARTQAAGTCPGGSKLDTRKQAEGVQP